MVAEGTVAVGVRLVHADRSTLRIDVTSAARRATTPTSVIATAGDVNLRLEVEAAAVVEGLLLGVTAVGHRPEVVEDRPAGRVGAEVAGEAILVAEAVAGAAAAPPEAGAAPHGVPEAPGVPGAEAAPPGVGASPVALHRGRLVHL